MQTRSHKQKWSGIDTDDQSNLKIHLQISKSTAKKNNAILIFED